MSDLRQAIREILAEEIARLRPELTAAAPQVTEEAITIRSSADLNDFALRLLDRAQDGRLIADLAAGRHRFALAGTAAPGQAAPPVHAHQPAAPAPTAAPQAEFLRGMVSERDIAGLADGTRVVRVGKSVRLTPLARDELARRGIQLERVST
ncbi:hypothetical protein [Acidimangrovimonas pyrenivorans]|uniref:Uncharacterized protein n=1 Tax=Acidimangrovimonas pyrenivorans TaxID=2030798 RepID=A0ABV7AEX0_9RHOB